MRQTTNLSLKLPDSTDYVNIEDINENMEKIDEEIAKINDPVNGVKQKLTEHLEEIMPHTYVDNGVKYRWGFRTVNGEGQFIYEEVV